MSMQRPLVGITADVLERSAGKFSAAAALAYCECVQRAGGVPLVLPPVVESAGDHARVCDAIVFTGGADPDLRKWGQEVHPEASLVHPQRQAYELRLLEVLRVERPAMPVLGICLGMQMMCLDAGGRLDQHLADSLETAEAHRNAEHGVHPIAKGEGCPVWLAAGGIAASNHHQGVVDPGKGLETIAVSGDGVIEAVMDRRRPFYVGVQWHPERTRDERLGLEVFRALIRAWEKQQSEKQQGNK